MAFMHSKNKRTIDDYRKIVGVRKIREIKKLARRLKGEKLLHVNSTAYGGGVAEILKSLIPVFLSLKIDTKWWVLEAPPQFFDVTKKIHNGLQGNKDLRLTGREKKLFIRTNEMNSKKINWEPFSRIIIHDPQPIALSKYVKNENIFWRCHIDISSPNRKIWSFIKPYLKYYKKVIFHFPDEKPKDLKSGNIAFYPPSIDPLSEKNKEIKEKEVDKTLEFLGINPEQRYILQVSRFDPWKGIYDVLSAFSIIKKKIKNLSLIFAGSFADDDPEGKRFFATLKKRLKNKENIVILTNLRDIEINALQRRAAIVFQLSKKEGFGLTVTESLWKGKIVIGRSVGGIKKQIKDGINGFLVNSPKEAALKAIKILRNEIDTFQIRRNAKKTVKEKYITPVHVKNILKTII